MRLLKAALAVAGASAYLAAPPAPLRVLRATPADTAGRAEWRDPVTVGKSFQAMDGSRLAVPYSYSFRVRTHVIRASASANRSDEVRVTIER